MFNADLLEKTPELRTFVYHNFDRQPRAIMNEIAELNRKYRWLRPSQKTRLGMLCDLLIVKCTEYERDGVEYHRVKGPLWNLGEGVRVMIAPGFAHDGYWSNDEVKEAAWNMLEHHKFVTLD